MRGKEKCRILREIRMDIARNNDIPLVIDECGHRGECRGTCPRCEAEVRYLEEQLERRRCFRKVVAVAGISVGMVAALSGCSAIDALHDALGGGGGIAGDIAPQPTPAEDVLDGIMPPDAPDDIRLMGDIGEMGEVPIAPDMPLGEVPPMPADGAGG